MPNLTDDTDFPLDAALTGAEKVVFVEGTDIKKVTAANLRTWLGIYTGTGTPEGAVTAPQGSLFLRTDGAASTTLYVKTSGAGNTGWTAK